jgi:beta-glucanase (GH16 family)
MPKTPSFTARLSLLVSLAALILGVGASGAFAATRSSAHSRKSAKHRVSAAWKRHHDADHRKHHGRTALKHKKQTNPAPTATTASTTTPAAASGLSGCTTSAPANVQPDGPAGTWTSVFDDEFDGNSVNKTSWSTDDGYVNQNDVTDSSRNIQVADGCVTLKLASATSGAEMTTNTVGLRIGDYAEARIQFAGNGTTVDNWPAFWAAGAGWPKSGEQDIFEGLGSATLNYHYSLNGSDTQAGPFNIAGNWAGSFHTYGVYRGPDYSRVYWDGHVVKTYPTDDNAGLENLLLTEGASNQLAFGASGEMLVDYVRVWKQS